MEEKNDTIEKITIKTKDQIKLNLMDKFNNYLEEKKEDNEEIKNNKKQFKEAKEKYKKREMLS